MPAKYVSAFAQAFCADRPAERAAVQVGVREVDSAVPTGHPGLVHRREKVAHTSGVGSSGVSPGSTKDDPGADRHPGAEQVAAGEALQHAGAGAAEGRVAGDVLGEGRSREGQAWYGVQVSPRISRVPLPGPAQASTSLPFIRVRTAVIGRT